MPHIHLYESNSFLSNSDTQSPPTKRLQRRFVVGVCAGISNTCGSYYYAKANYDVGSCLFNIGCSIAVLLVIHDLWTETYPAHKRFAAVLNCVASMLFSIGVVFYYPSVTRIAGENGLWFAGVLFVLGCFLFLISDRVTAKFCTQVVAIPVSLGLFADIEGGQSLLQSNVSECKRVVLALRDEVAHIAILLFVMGSMLFLPFSCQVASSAHVGSWFFFIGGAINVVNTALPVLLSQLGARVPRLRLDSLEARCSTPIREAPAAIAG